ncbi:MAG: preprotein translocase subunit SecA [Gammaproteobacteria bacterium]
MLSALFKKVFGSRDSRYLRKLRPQIARINEMEPRLHQCTDDELVQHAQGYRQQLADGVSESELLPEVFAAVREVARRALGMRHFDCQLVGGMVLNHGAIAEMKTGEGKTLVATLAASFNALAGRKVYLVTVNDYLAERDANWMRPVYEGLGLSVGVIKSGQSPQAKKEAYQADIIYATNAELGFDYLRDRMALHPDDQLQVDLDYAIVDEVDSILIDEARTPLIISGPGDKSDQLYHLADSLIPKLDRQMREEDKDNPLADAERGDYWVDESRRQVELTDQGHERIEQLLQESSVLSDEDNLYSSNQLKLLHYIQACLRAHTLYQRNVHYIVRQGEVLLIDEHTGRALPGRRLGHGIHQALECREGLQVREETQTLASTTYQNFFRLFGKLAGMTGTATTEAVELHEIYQLSVLEIPTNKELIRADYNDLVYVNRQEKFKAVVAHIQLLQQNGTPCLVGTASIETSEHLSGLLKKNRIRHSVLNAKNHLKEAEIIEQAGRPGVVTIATNMAGRGTDIVLGGNWEAEIANLKASQKDTPSDKQDEQIAQIKSDWAVRHQQVIEAGGLFVLGTERHESRRIDNQLRGRSGRQGDRGASQFYLSLDDDLIRIFASEGMRNLLARTMGKDSSEPIEANMLSRAIARAQMRVEGQNFEVRKQLLEYDDVANEQRTIIYAQRDSLLRHEDVTEMIHRFRQQVLTDTCSSYVSASSVYEDWDVAGLQQVLASDFNLDLPIQQWLDGDMDLDAEGLSERILGEADAVWEAKKSLMGERADELARQIMLQVLDRHWKEHLLAMDHLRSSIHLRAYAQRNPRQEYKREAFEYFEQFIANFQYDTTRLLLVIRLETDGSTMPAASRPEARRQARPRVAAQPSAAPNQAPAQPPQGTERSFSATPSAAKVGRNQPCPCGSGKKHKFCCGRT